MQWFSRNLHRHGNRSQRKPFPHNNCNNYSDHIHPDSARIRLRRGTGRNNQTQQPAGSTTANTEQPAKRSNLRDLTLDVTAYVVKGTNTLTFTHANWDCQVVDNTKNVQITDSTGTIIFSDPTIRPLSCTQSITYTFTI